MWKYGLCVVFALSLSARELSVNPASDRIVIDGKLDDSAWRTVEFQSNFSFLASRKLNRRPQADTMFKILKDEANIYLGIRCNEPDMSKLRAQISEYDENPWRDDVVEVFFSPDGMPAQFYQFVVTAGGATWQMYYEEKGVTRPDPYFPIYETAVFHGPDFWSVEMRIPLKAFYMTRQEYWKNNWLFNIARCRTQGNEWTTWSPLINSFHESENFHKVSSMPIRAAREDIYIRNVSFKTESRTGREFRGSLDVEIIGGSGKCRIGSDVPSAMIELRSGENHISIPNMVFTETGRQQVNFSVKNDQGMILAERRFPVYISHRAITLKFNSPGYGNCFFPGQDASRLKGEIIVVAADEPAITIDGKSSKLEKTDGKYIFDLDISDIGKEQFEFTVNCGSEQETVSIRKLKPSKTTMVWIENNHLVINGKPSFALGWYGFNWSMSAWSREKYPNPGAKHPYNFYGQLGLEPMRLLKGIEEKEATRDVKPSLELLEKIREKIEAARERDFMYYYLCDEPECRGISPVYLKHLYDFIKKLDPYHPVMIISRSPEKYLECCDIINPHPYLNPLVDDKGVRTLKLSVANVRDMCRKVAVADHPDKVLMLTPQTFSYAFNNVYADFTTFDETNASIWSSVCQGGRGITPYIWFDHMSRPDLDLGCDFIYQSLERLAEKLTASAKSQPLRVSNPEVDSCLLGNMLILVNLSQKIQKAEVASESLEDVDILYKFRENDTISLRGGRFNVDMMPYQVLALTPEPCDDGLETLPEVRRKIAEAEHARSSRGNILFGKGRDIELSFPPSSPYDVPNMMEQQVKLFDGILDSAGWLPRGVAGPLWYELSFPKFVPKFNKARIYGHALKGATLKIKKFGEWQHPPAEVTIGDYWLEFDFGKTLSTISIRLDFPGKKVELYEIELYQ